MDDYPEALAPEFEPSGAVKTPFEEWWSRVSSAFPAVPEEVARDWLHRHWGHSPFRYLPSKDYVFRKETWPSQSLWQVRSNWCAFDPNNIDCVAQGEYQAQHLAGPLANRLALYIRDHGTFPVPITILDNRDGHLCAEKVDKPYKALPQAYVLIEGHRRFNLGLHFQRQGRMKPDLDVWVMRRA